MENKISAKIIADSVNPWGQRLTTFELVYPRFIHAEMLTHRMFSKNSASSRAIPFKKMIKSIQDEPFIPIAWQKDHSGMQGTEYLEDELSIQMATSTWLSGRDHQIKVAQSLNKSDNGFEGVTKQLCNRLVEPFMYIKVLLTATEFDNFFELRCPRYETKVDGFGIQSFKSKRDLVNAVHESKLKSFDKFTQVDWLKINKGAAEIHLMDLAEKMWDARNESKPQELKEGDWHIPYLEQINLSEINKISTKLDNGQVIEEVLNTNFHFFGDSQKHSDYIQDSVLKVSTMMCARTSYTTIDTDDSVWTIEKYLKKYQELIDYKHGSPLEHCSQVPTEDEYYNNVKGEVLGYNNYGETKDRNIIGRTIESFHYTDSRLFGWFDNYHGFQSLRYQLEHELRL